MVEIQTPQDPAQETQEPEISNDEILEQAEQNPNIEVDDGSDPEETTEGTEVPKAGNWYDNLGPDYKNDPDVTKYKTLDEYVKGNREVRKMIGKDKLVVPTKNSTPEEINNFYEKLGRPKEATAYTLPNIEMPDPIKTSDTEIEAYRKKAFEIGLTNKQFEELYAMQSEMTIQKYNSEIENTTKIKQESETALRGEFGEAYDVKIDGAQKVINTFFKGQEMHPAFAVLANDKGFIKAMANIAENIGEDAIAGDIRQTLTPTEAQKEWDSVIAGSHDLSKAYFDELNPEHNAAVDRVITLQRLALAGTK